MNFLSNEQKKNVSDFVVDFHVYLRYVLEKGLGEAPFLAFQILHWYRLASF